MSKTGRRVYYRPMSDIPVLVSTAQAARTLGVTTRTVQRMAESGDLAIAFRLDGKRGALLFLEADVRETADRRRHRAA